MDAAVAWVEAALSQLHSLDQDSIKAAEAALLQFQHSPAAWTLCLHLSQQQQQAGGGTVPPNLLLFAAQTLRTKINDSGSRLDAQHLEQLKQALLQRLMDPQLPTALLRQLCLAVASLAALLPSWQGWLQPVAASLPQRNAVQLLHDVAEEGSSDWRHVTVPGLTSSEKLSWATTTRDRFRSMSSQALQLLLSLVQQQQQVTVGLLECLTAWVKLGCLHHVAEQEAEATAQVGLMHIQSPQEEMVLAALGLLAELPEYAPEQLIKALEPHMLQVAAAALHAATGPQPDLMHAAAWVAAFAAYAAAVPHKLLAASEEEDEEGSVGGSSSRSIRDLRQALLQVSGLPHIHASQLLCLPALHVWSTVLGHESPAAAAAFTAAGGGSGGLSRANTAAEAAEEAEAADVAAALQAVAGDADADATPHAVPSCVTQACYQLLLQTACNCMLWGQTPQGREASGTLEASAAVHDVFLAVSCLLGQQQYLQCVVHVWGSQQQPLPYEEAVQHVLQAIAAAAPDLRLYVAVEMAAAAAAAAAVVPPAGDDNTAGAADGDAALQQVCASIAGLLSSAAAQVRQGPQLPHPLPGQLSLCFCQAVQVWASYLMLHFVSAASQGVQSMGSLLELLLAVAARQQDQGSTVRPAAAAAVRTLTAAGLHLGWDKLYLGTPLLLQAVQRLVGVDSADQDLFASLSMCLAAVGAPEQELQEIRVRSSQQLVEPVVQLVNRLLQQLQAPSRHWSSMSKAADALLCQHMVAVRVVLEAAWQRQERMQGQPTGSAGGAAYAELSDDASPAAAATGMDEDSEAAAEAWTPERAAGSVQDMRADLDSNPAVQLVLSQLWPALHTLVVQHAGSGKFLQHYAKCCCKLLKLRPELLLRPQQQLLQFLELCVVGLVRPGGCGLAEPLLAALDLCCQQQGSGLLLESGPSLNQAIAQLWALPEVLALRQAGRGDAQPDLTEAVLKLSTAWLRHSAILQPTSTQLAATLPSVIAAAAACVRCCHKKAGSCALAALLALLGTAAAEGSGSQQQFQEVVASHAVVVAHAALSALLVPTPLPRLHKVCSVLLELAALASLVEQAGPDTSSRLTWQHGASSATAANGFAASQGSSGGGSAPQGVLHAWLLQATQGFVPAVLSAAGAADLAAACASLLLSTPQPGGAGARCRQVPASRSYAAARRLKKRLRDFAEKHIRSNPDQLQ